VSPSLAAQFFEIVTNDKRTLRLSICKQTMTIGRAADNDIVIDERFPGYETVADHHARIELRSDLAIIEDLKTPVGIYVNDHRTNKNVLRNGWRVGLGGVELVFRTIGLGTMPLNLPDESAAGSSEQIKAQHIIEPFSTLPEGAVINNRYAVIEVRDDTPHLKTYTVENLDPVRMCSQCGFEVNPIDRATCVNCSASLGDTMPYYPHYQVRETDTPNTLAIESRLAGLVHPAVLLPREWFSETPYGDAVRYYLVGPESPSRVVATMRVPQKLTDVLEWGAQLADGMFYLHQNGVAMGVVDAWRVALQDHHACWVDFSSCEYPAEDELPDRIAADVVGLAKILYYLATGQHDYAPPADIKPPAVSALFDQVLGLELFQNAQQYAQALRATLVEVRRPLSVDLRVGRYSDVGQVRHLNEDSVLTLDMARIQCSISEPVGLYAVADGMGGHTAGEVASALAVDTLARKAIAELWPDVLANTQPDVKVWLKQAIQEANQAVFGRRRAATTDMGTTIVAALVCCGTGVTTIAHAGDSRAYVINQNEIRQITTDHSLVQRLIQMGQLKSEDARTHPQRNVIYKNLGDKPRVEPDINSIELAPNDRLLLCSDGLSGMVEDKQIHQIVLAASSPQEACKRLVDAANAAGGEDNISVIVIQIEALG
jgi:protein phosphatase